MIQNAQSRYNNSGAWVKYDFSALVGYNSNSFAYTLLNNVGLGSFFGSPHLVALGWGQVVPGLR